MKIANIEINREKWISLLKELYDFQGSASKSYFQLDRYCRCIDIDVKCILKTCIEFNFDSNRKLKLTMNASLTTDCVALRRCNYFWSDKETIIVVGETDSLNRIDDVFDKCIDEFIEKLEHFRICTICRLLYKDGRASNEESICIHCRYDQTFFVQDLVCVICNESVQKDDQTFTLTCAHTYHSDCILLNFIKTNKRECPLCRETDSHQL